MQESALIQIWQKTATGFPDDIDEEIIAFEKGLRNALIQIWQTRASFLDSINEELNTFEEGIRNA